MNRLATASIMALAGILLMIPAGASAAQRADGSNCAYTADEPTPVNTGDLDPGAGELVVYAGTGDGASGVNEATAGVCLNTNTAADDFEGGTAEAGLSVGNGGPIVPGVVADPWPVGVYAFADGDNNNVDPSAPENSSQGYIGLSNQESKAAENDCAAPDPDLEDGTGTNSGGCLSIRTSGNPGEELVALPVPFVACGNDSGKRFDETGRDGCTLPS